MGKQADRINNLILKTVRDVVRTAQLRSLQAITSGTPVDTGFARGGWTPTLGRPATDPLIPPTDETAARAAGSTNLAANQARSLRIASSYQLQNGPVFLTNAVPYIERLNEGSSAQAPAKFVEKAIEEALRVTVAGFNA